MKKFKMMAKKGISIFLCTATLFSFPITSYAGTGYTDPNMKSQYYTNGSKNPYVYRYQGECTWYVYGRAYEKLGIKLLITSSAKNFWNTNKTLQKQNSGYTCGSEPRPNSIMVWDGHVAFCEKVIGDTIYYTEANWGKSGFNGEKQVKKGNESKGGQTFKGYIYLEDKPPIEDGKYRIHSKSNSDKFADIELASQDNGAPLILFQGKDNDNDNQWFYFNYVSNGYYVIVCCHSEKVLDIEGANSENASGKKIIQYNHNGNDNQLWRLEKTSDGYFIIISKLGDYAMDVYENKTEDNTPITAFRKHGEINQQFDLRTW